MHENPRRSAVLKHLNQPIWHQQPYHGQSNRSISFPFLCMIRKFTESSWPVYTLCMILFILLVSLMFYCA